MNSVGRASPKALLAGVMAGALLCSTGALGGGVAAAESDDNGDAGQTLFVLGGARGPGIPWDDYVSRAGRGYHPNAQRVVVDYPAGMIYGRLPEEVFPGSDLATASVGESVAAGTDNLDAAIRSRKGPAVAVGLSEGTMVLDAEQARLANDPTAPPPDQLSFTVISDPARGVLTEFPPGTYLPIVDYTVQPQVESQYHTNVVIAEYDAIADFPDRPWNLISLANAVIAGATVHTSVAFGSPADVPPENITTTTNSRGGTTTTYLVPTKQLPLTQPLRDAGVSSEFTDEIDRALWPEVRAGYARYDGRVAQASSQPPAAPVNLEAPVSLEAGLDPTARANLDGIVHPTNPVNINPVLDPTSQANLDGFLKQARGLFP
ncbi:MAG: PE-PPE domain-containing protein [Mycobacterium sp.]